jgi:hypothetical protein
MFKFDNLIVLNEEGYQSLAMWTQPLCFFKPQGVVAALRALIQTLFDLYAYKTIYATGPIRPFLIYPW